MPAVQYDYNYYNRNGRSSKNATSSVARSKNSTARNVQTTSRANTKRVSQNNVSRTTQNRTNKSTTTRSRAKYDIDIPVMVKKKVEIQKPKEMKLTRPKSKAVAHKKEGIKRTIFCSLIAISAFFLICVRYAEINEKFNQVNSLEKDLNSAVALNQQLSSDIESKTDLGYIEKYAKYQLGMQKPDDSQVVRIAYDKQDKISSPIVIEEEKEEDFISKLINDLKNLID